jgi:hypothetical protein
VTSGCPSCGVAVIPGYVKCPRCHAVLPSSGRIPRVGLDPGGTSVQERAFPFVPVAVGAVAIAVVLLLVLGGGKKKAAPASDGEAASALVQPAPATAAPAPQPPTNAAPAPQASAAAAAAPQVPAPAAPAAPAPPPRPLDIPAAGRPNPGAAAAELERALGRQRLWSTVQASGERVEVRSGSCADPAIGPVIDAARTALRGAGLTRLQCLAQSGAVVFERDL